MSEPQQPEAGQESAEKADLPPPEWRSREAAHEPFPDDLAESATPRRRRTGLILIAIVLAVLGAAITAYALLPQLSPLLGTLFHTTSEPGTASGTTAPTSNLPLDKRVATLEQRVETVENELARTRVDLEGRIAATAGTLDMVQKQLAAAGLTGRQANNVEARLAALEATVGKLETAPLRAAGATPAPGTAPATEAMAKNLAAAETRTESETAAAARAIAELRQQVGSLTQSLASEAAARARLARNLSVEVAGASGNAHQIGLILALQQLDQAAAGSHSFADALKGVEALKPPAAFAAPLARLKPLAPAGVPSPADLRLSFDALAANIVRTAEAPQGTAWWRRVLRRLSSLVVVRRIGDVPGDTPDAIVARAEQRLDAGDLADAVKELDQLKGAAAEAAAGWLKGAKARLAIESALAELQSAATVTLTSPAAPAGPAAPARAK